MQVVRHAVEASAPVSTAARITVEADLPDELWLVADALRLAQLVDNLLANAVKYTAEGGTVTVALGVDDGHVELAVTDTGIGIAAPDRDRLFTPFFRSAAAEQQAAQGAGLGLSISKSIVESHGGRIGVESEVGVGSTFRVRLPLR